MFINKLQYIQLLFLFLDHTVSDYRYLARIAMTLYHT